VQGQDRNKNIKEDLRKEKDQRVRITLRMIKGKVGIIFRVKSNHFYLGLRPTVDIALIPLCHTQFSEENQVLPICLPGSIFIHIVTS
jgi:hypothetical protein